MNIKIMIMTGSSFLIILVDLEKVIL